MMSRSSELQMPGHETGATLIESLVAILIFSFGLLGLVGLQAASIKNTTEAKYRADAAFLANQIVGLMWADNPANLASYAHNPTVGVTPCTPQVAASLNPAVTNWITEGVAKSLPGAGTTNQQIVVNAATGLVTVTVCWQPTAEATPNFHITATQIAGQAP